MPIYALGDRVPNIDPTAFVHPDAVIIGSVTIGAESTIWAGAVLRGDDGEIFIGARTSIQDNTVIHTMPSQPTRVGDDCVIGHIVHLESCTIESGAQVSSGALVLHRVVVGTGAKWLRTPSCSTTRLCPRGHWPSALRLKSRSVRHAPKRFSTASMSTSPKVNSFVTISGVFRHDELAFRPRQFLRGERGRGSRATAGECVLPPCETDCTGLRERTLRLRESRS